MYEYDLLSLALLFFTGVLAGVINVMAGGGSSIVLPVLIFLGIDSTVANGTNRVAILFQNFFATLSFKKEGIADVKTGIRLAAFTLPGVLVGAFAAVRVGDELFEKILAIVLIFVCVSFFFKVDSFGKLLGGSGETGRGWILYPALVLIGFYGGFIQVGVGLFIMAALYHLMGASLARGERAQGNYSTSLHCSRDHHIFPKREHKLVHRNLSCGGELGRRMVRCHVLRQGRRKIHKVGACHCRRIDGP